MKKNNFIDTYCRWVTDFNGKEVLSLKEKSNKDCILWDSGCLAYLGRPLQCRAFPFWESIVSSSQKWNIAASACPGMDSGETHSGAEIEEYLKMRRAEAILEKAGRINQ